jgi:ABC-type glycerol-3-phosphate transport system permease component
MPDNGISIGRGKRSVPRLAIRYVLVTAFVLITLFPLYWIIASSLKPAPDVFLIPPHWLVAPALGNYREILGLTNSNAGGTDFLRYTINSVVIAVGTAIPSLVFGTLAAYGITHCRVQWGSKYLAAVLAGRLVPPMVLLVPLFVMFTDLHLIDTQLAVIITLLCFGLPFVIWMMTGFLSALPRELDEAALVDGCSRLGSLVRVVLPASTAGLVVTALFVLLAGWNEYLIPLVLTENNAEPIAVAIQGYVSGFNTEWGPLFAASTLAFLPVLVTGAIAQKYLVRGFTAGSIKG